MPRCTVLVKGCLMLLASIVVAGCAQDPYGPGARCRLVADPPLPDLVAHLNQNIERMASLRASNARIRSSEPGAAPITLSATMAVEAPRNFRLVASSILGSEVDLGSNDEQFWFWMKRAPQGQKYVFTASHDRLAQAQQRFPIPFQPDWLIEALGVIPIDPSEITYEPGPPGSHRATLVAQRVSPGGLPVTKTTVVDTCHGLVLEHGLYNERGQLIARAVLSGHYNDRATNLPLPRQIDLDWPQAQLKMAITLGPVEVNSVSAPQAWQLPAIPGYPVVDLGQ